MCRMIIYKTVGTGLLILLLLLNVKDAGAQSPGNNQTRFYSFQQIDSLSYQAYCEKNWDEVIRIANQGLRQGMDYYYLRIRLGIALFRQKKFVRSIPHFKKALGLNNHDPVALEFLYYAFINSGRKGEADRIAGKMPATLQKKLGIQSKYVTLFGERGTMFTPNLDSILSYRPEAAVSHHYFIYKYDYSSVGISGKINPALGFTAAWQTMYFSARQQFNVAGFDPFQFNLPFRQNALYLGGRVFMKRGVSLIAGMQVLTANYRVMEYRETQEDGGSYVPVDQKYVDMAMNTELHKRLPNLDAGLSIDINRIRSVWRYQGGLHLTWYPLGNLQLYLQGESCLTGLVQTRTTDYPVVTRILSGFQILPKCWVEGVYTFGTIRYWSENQAYVVYNNLDPLKSRADINLLGFNILPHLDLSLRYQWSKRTTSWQLYQDNEPAGTEQLDYSFQSLIGGIVWKF